MMIAVFTLAGLLLRMATVLSEGTLWFDEEFSVHFASYPLADGLPLLIRDIHPPLYYTLLHGWMEAFGTSPTAARMLSVVLGAAAIPAVAMLAKRVSGSPVAATVAAALTAFSPILVLHSAEARMYPLLILASCLSLYAFMNLLERKSGFVPWAVAAGAMLSTHLSAAGPFAVMVIAGIFTFRPDRKLLKRFLAASAVAALPFMLWLGIAAIARGAETGSEWQLHTKIPPSALGTNFVEFFALGAEPWQKSFLFAFLGACLLAALFEWSRQAPLSWTVRPTGRRETWILLACMAAPFLMFLGIITGMVKYMLAAYPAAAVLVAYGFTKLAGKKPFWPVVTCVALVMLCSLPSNIELATQKRYRFDEIARFIEEREMEGDAVYLERFAYDLPFESHYQGALPVLMHDAFPELNNDEALILHTGQGSTPVQFEEAERFLGETAERYRRIFFVGGPMSLSDATLRRWFLRNGWKWTDRFMEDSPVGDVFVFENPAY